VQIASILIQVMLLALIDGSKLYGLGAYDNGDNTFTVLDES